MTYPEALIEQEETKLLTSDVTVEELNMIVPRRDELDFVHDNRLNMVKGHVLNLLDPEFPKHYRYLEEAYLRHLGALSVIEYLPEV